MNVIVIDDDRLVALSLKTILESDPSITVQAVGSSAEEAISLCRSSLPDVLLMDIRMEGRTGLEAGEELLASWPELKILFLTTFSDDEYIVRALHMGARGYLLKQNYESIVPSLKAIQMGQSVFGGEIIQKIPDLLLPSNHFDYQKAGILQKEEEIIKLVAEGMSNKEIAQTLYLSEGTVRNYLSSILEKLELRDRTQLAIFYYQKGSGLS